LQELDASLRFSLAEHVFSANQRVIIRAKEEIFKMTVDDCEPPSGLLHSASLLRFDSESGELSLTQNAHAKRERIFPNDFDFEKIGVGGLGKEFSVIFRRAFASRLFNPTQAKARGIKHVRGMILYGPPGTGSFLFGIFFEFNFFKKNLFWSQVRHLLPPS